MYLAVQRLEQSKSDFTFWTTPRDDSRSRPWDVGGGGWAPNIGEAASIARLT